MRNIKDMVSAHEWTVSGAAVSDETAVEIARAFSESFARRFNWKDGAEDVLHATWLSVARARAAGLAVILWHRRASYDMIDFYRDLTNWRKVERTSFVQFPDNSDVLNIIRFSGVQTTECLIPARRYSTDSVDSLLTEYEDDLKKIPPRHHVIIRGIAEGRTLADISIDMGVSESRVSQLLGEILEITGGEYPRGVITNEGYAQRARVPGSRRDRREKKNLGVPLDTEDING